MNCANCGAPLRAHNPKCRYCQTLNDVDLRAVQAATRTGTESDRSCPICDVVMETISIGSEPAFQVERCARCLGIFFDVGELQALLDRHAAADQLDHQRLRALVEQQPSDELHEERVRSTFYVKCPVCRHLMLRKGFGGKSTVIADECRDHGVWLDGGELGRLLRWSQAGGQIYRAQRKAEERREKKREARLASMLEEVEERRTAGSYAAGGWHGGLLGLALGLFIGLRSRR